MVINDTIAKPKIGILALQGDVDEHELMLTQLGISARRVTLPKHIDDLDGMIIPGGESTTIAKLIELYKLRQPIQNNIKRGMALWGTCAGMILIGNQVDGAELEPLNLLDVGVQRNWYGRQTDSFEACLKIRGLDGGEFKAVFIRAPAFTRIGEGTQIIAELDDGTAVAVIKDNLMATAFHPELTDDKRLHQLFLDLATNKTQPLR